MLLHAKFVRLERTLDAKGKPLARFAGRVITLYKRDSSIAMHVRRVTHRQWQVRWIVIFVQPVAIHQKAQPTVSRVRLVRSRVIRDQLPAKNVQSELTAHSTEPLNAETALPVVSQNDLEATFAACAVLETTSPIATPPNASLALPDSSSDSVDR